MRRFRLITTNATTQLFTAMIKMAMAMQKESRSALKPGTYSSSSGSVPKGFVEFGVQFCVVKQLADDIVQHCAFTLHSQLYKIKKEAMIQSNESDQNWLALWCSPGSNIAFSEVRPLMKPQD